MTLPAEARREAQQKVSSGGYDAGQRPERFAAARNMSGAWAAFARNGNPNTAGLPEWPAYDTARRATMVLDAKCRVVDDPFPGERKLWEEPGGGFPR